MWCVCMWCLFFLNHFVYHAGIMFDVYFPPVPVCIPTHCNAYPASCLRVSIYVYVSVWVLSPKGLCVWMNKQATLQPFVAHGHREGNSTHVNSTTPEGQYGYMYMAPLHYWWLVMVLSLQDSKRVDVLTQSWWRHVKYEPGSANGCSLKRNEGFCKVCNVLSRWAYWTRLLSSDYTTTQDSKLIIVLVWQCRDTEWQ